MESLLENKHAGCLNWDLQNRVSVGILNLKKEDIRILNPSENEILFLVEGCIRITISDYPNYAINGSKDQIFFLATSNQYSFRALTDTQIVVFRLSEPIMLCENYSLERLFLSQKMNKNASVPDFKPFYPLEMNSRIKHFLQGMIDVMHDEIKCKAWSGIKIKECLFMLQFYYPTEELYHFFYPILSADMLFSEYVRLHWRKFQSVKNMAEAMNLTPKQFNTRFISVFRQTPYQWMMDRRAGLIKKEIAFTGKLFKQIALENGFSSDAQFTRFCKNELGATPTAIRERRNLLLK